MVSISFCVAGKVDAAAFGGRYGFADFREKIQAFMLATAISGYAIGALSVSILSEWNDQRGRGYRNSIKRFRGRKIVKFFSAKNRNRPERSQA